MSDQTQTAPAVTGVTPYINVIGASDASAFYQRAFGAREVTRLPAQDGKRLMHCHVVINGGNLLLSDCFPEHGFAHEPSRSFTLHLQVDDVDTWWSRAVEAGCEVVMAPEVMFWGDKYGTLRDPFQVTWSLASTPKA
ncbi:MAG TPA: VOC family protein [Phenylobacterium sp.]|nr:VOC family protein [Phenylobacterium sp.]